MISAPIPIIVSMLPTVSVTVSAGNNSIEVTAVVTGVAVNVAVTAATGYFDVQYC
jgi:hypothetical protein